MATDIYPAIRAEVEALIRATERVSEHRAVSKADLDAYDATRAALNRRVEALMRFSYGNGWNDSVLDKGDGENFTPNASNDSLLNEEPAE